jgi:hypothetical protein
MKKLVEGQWDEDTWKVIAQIMGWATRGDGAAIYRNADMGHPDVGLAKIVSYGSPAAQLEVSEPPQQLPNGIPAGAINWRFQLVATYRPPHDAVDLCPVCGAYNDFPCRDQSSGKNEGKLNVTDHHGRPQTMERDMNNYGADNV